MKKLIDTVLNDTSKKTTALTKNYYFAVTLIISFLLVIIYACCGRNVGDFYTPPVWKSFSINNLFQAFVNSFEHGTLQHCLLNTLCFLIAGGYLERKKGSIKFFLFLALEITFTAYASTTNDVSLSWYGFSGANYGLYGYIILDYLNDIFYKERRNKVNIILGAVILGLIYLAMCFCGGTSTFAFAWYPYDLLNNLGHASGFMVGIFLGVINLIDNVLNYYHAKKLEK